MNRLLSAILGVGMILLGASASWGQDSAPTSLVRTFQPGMQWTVDISPPERKSGEGPALTFRRIREVREENAMGVNLRRQTVSFSNGAPLTRYALGEMVLYPSEQTNQIEIQSSSPELPGGVLSAKRFTELAWISAVYREGVEKLGDRTCDVYRRPWVLEVSERSSEGEGESVTEPSPESLKASPQMTAYIDQATRLPVRLETPEGTRVYTFLPDSAPAVLPAEYQKAWDDRLARIEKRKLRFKIPQ